MRLHQAPVSNFGYINSLRTLCPGVSLLIGACLAGVLLPSPSLRAADDINIDGTSYASPAVFGDTTATSTVTFNNNVMVSATAGSTLNLADAFTTINAPGGETITFGSAGNTGTIILRGSASVTGSAQMFLAYGTLQFSSDLILASSGWVVNGTLDLNGWNATLLLVQGTGAIINSSSTLSGISVDVGASSLTFDGTISGAIRLALSGSATGQWTLTNINTYTGGTTVAGTTLEITDLATNIGSGGITLNNGTLFTNQTSGSVTTAGQDLHVGDLSTGTLLTSDSTTANYQNLSGGVSSTVNVGNSVYHAGKIGFSGNNTAFEGTMNVAAGMTVGVFDTDALGSANAQFVLGAGVDPVTLSMESSNAVTLHNTFDLSANDLSITTNPSLNSLASLTLANTLDDGGNGHGLNLLATYVTLQGNNSYTGGTRVINSILVYSQNENLGASVPAITLNNGLLFYDPSGPAGQTLVSNATFNLTGNGVLAATTGNTVVYQGNITGPAGLFLGTTAGGFSNDQGLVVVTGNNSYVGAVIGGLVGVGSNTALGSGDVQLIQGRLQTYGAQHTIHVATDFYQSEGTVFLNASGPGASEHDELVVGGTAYLSLFSGTTTLSVNLLDGYHPTAANPLVVLEAGVVDGTFDQVLLSNGRPAVVTYTSTQILIYQLLFGTTPGLTPNQQAMADNLDNVIPGSSPAMLALINELSPASDTPALAPLLNQLSPQALQVLGHVAFDNTTFATQRLNNHLANLRDGLTGFDASQVTYSDPSLSAPLARIQGRLLAWNPSASGPRSDAGSPLLDARSPGDPVNRFSTFLAGDVIIADAGRNADLSHQDYTTGSVALGGDYRLTHALTVGVQLAYGRTDANLDGLGSEATVDSYSPGIYASYVDGGWYANGSLNYSYDRHEENRNVQIGAITGTNRGSTHGDHTSANFTGGYEFDRKGWKLGVFGGLQYVDLGIDSFTESGPTALTIGSQDAESLRSQLGVTARYALHRGSFTLTPHASVSWQHEFLDDSRGITSQFSGSGAGSFTIFTSDPERDSALINLGLNADITHRLTLFADYLTQVGQADFFAQSVQAGLRIGF